MRDGLIRVLILVVVDNGLVQVNDFDTKGVYFSLNPCCSGQWSRTLLHLTMSFILMVLILVVVDNGLVQSVNIVMTLGDKS